MKRQLFWLFPALIFLFFQGVAEDTVLIRGEKYANWWTLGENIRFSSAQKIAGPITGKLYDSNNRCVYEKTVSAAEFNQDGWNCQWKTPGFYEAEFVMNNQFVKYPWPLKVLRIDPKNPSRYIWDQDKMFFASRHPLVVAPSKVERIEDVSPQFGGSFDLGPDAVAVGRLVGLRSIRLHALRWDLMEKEKGKIDWSKSDAFMAAVKAAGYPQESVVLNLFGVPRWASSRPDATQINVFLPEYTSVVPRDMKDWTDFIRAVMARYPQVKTYELWNEPHIKGFSCFWSDSVENFVSLLKAGYETVKSVKPDSTVWLGGIALRYLPFYEKLLQQGGHRYFDVLPLHGAWQSPQKFHELEEKYAVARKPVVSSEWHAMLLTPAQAAEPSEKLLSRNMLLDFLSQIRAGVEEVDLFCMVNYVEKETLEHYRRIQWFHVHTGGLFRNKPYLQPRLPALAWHNMITYVRGKLRVGDGFRLEDGRQCVIRLDSDNGPMLLIWNATDKPEKISPRILESALDGSSILDMEGKNCKISPDLLLKPEEYYVMFKPATGKIAGWKKFQGEVLTPSEAKVSQRHDVRASYRNGTLFDGNFQLISPETLRYYPLEKQVRCNPALPAGKIQGRFAVGVTPDYFDLVVEVRDAKQQNSPDDFKVWDYDSVQFAFDTTGEGYEKNRLEIGAALNEKNESMLWKIIAPALGGDLPGHYTPAGKKIRYGRIEISRKADVSLYKIRLNASELYPFIFSKLKPIRFSLIVNNNDGAGRASYWEWGSGIGAVKDLGLFGDLTIQPEPTALPSQKQLIHKGWNVNDYQLELRNDSVRVIGSSKVCSGVTTKAFPVTPGAVYRVTYSARGNASVICMVSGEGIRRMDIGGLTKLTGEWQNFDLKLIAPENAKSAAIYIFAWGQPGCEFEVRDFEVSAQ